MRPARAEKMAHGPGRWPRKKSPHNLCLFSRQSGYRRVTRSISGFTGRASTGTVQQLELQGLFFPHQGWQERPFRQPGKHIGNDPQSRVPPAHPEGCPSSGKGENPSGHRSETRINNAINFPALYAHQDQFGCNSQPPELRCPVNLDMGMVLPPTALGCLPGTRSWLAKARRL